MYGYGKTAKAIAKEIEKDYLIIKIRKNSFNKRKKLTKGNLIVLSAGNLKKLLGKEYQSTHEIRLKETILNKELVEEFVKKMKGLKTTIIVLTNNSDLFTQYLRKKLNRLNVYSFGLELDKKRFSNLIGKDIEVVGHHGLAIPLIKNPNKQNYLKITREADKMVLDSIKNNKLNYKFIAKVFANYLKNFNAKKKKEKLTNIEKELLEETNKKIKKDYKSVFKT